MRKILTQFGLYILFSLPFLAIGQIEQYFVDQNTYSSSISPPKTDKINIYILREEKNHSMAIPFAPQKKENSDSEKEIFSQLSKVLDFDTFQITILHSYPLVTIHELQEMYPDIEINEKVCRKYGTIAIGKDTIYQNEKRISPYYIQILINNEQDLKWVAERAQARGIPYELNPIRHNGRNTNFIKFNHLGHLITLLIKDSFLNEQKAPLKDIINKRDQELIELQKNYSSLQQKLNLLRDSIDQRISSKNTLAINVGFGFSQILPFSNSKKGMNEYNIYSSNNYNIESKLSFFPFKNAPWFSISGGFKISSLNINIDGPDSLFNIIDSNAVDIYGSNNLYIRFSEIDELSEIISLTNGGLRLEANGLIPLNKRAFITGSLGTTLNFPMSVKSKATADNIVFKGIFPNDHFIPVFVEDTLKNFKSHEESLKLKRSYPEINASLGFLYSLTRKNSANRKSFVFAELGFARAWRLEGYSDYAYPTYNGDKYNSFLYLIDPLSFYFIQTNFGFRFSLN